MTIMLTKLPSGLTVVTDRMDSVETISIGVWVGSGTRHERSEWNGIAHLLEHMAFKGTGRRTAQAIAEEIEAVGGQLNAYTAREHTAYYAKVLSGDLALSIDILADILQNSSFDPTELERERSVVLQEIGQARDTPDDIVFDHFQAAAFPDQPMGRSVLGTTDIVGHMGRDALFEYMRSQYAAEKMILAAAGRVDHTRLVELASEHFRGLLPNGHFKPDPARYAGGEIREERALEQLHLVVGFDGIPFDDPDYYAASALSTLLGGGMSSRLFQEVREKRGLAYNIYSFGSSYSDSGLFGIYAGTSESMVDELVRVIGGETVAIADKVSQSEIDRARAQLKASILMALESTGARCERLATNLLVYGRIIPIEEIVAQIDAIDETAIRRVARRILESRPTIAAVGPTRTLQAYDSIAGRFR
jgi:predicted Zn-dependent peptidase